MSANCPVCGSPVGPADSVCKTCGAPLSAEAANAGLTLQPGQVMHNGQYKISRVLGRGGFGITYDAQDQQLGLRVAMKELFVDGSQRSGLRVIPPGSLSTAEFQETKKRFLDEAKVLARFNHPGIVRVHSYFEENNTAYLVMEFLEGNDLGHQIEKQGRVPPAIVAEIGRAVAQTLEHIHGAGLLHRDIKPDNIYLTKDGRIVLIDFGSVRAFAPGKTMSHTRLVTPGYAPLEQYGNAAKFGPYTDIYALGATLHHALTGQMPPPATDLMLGTPLPLLPSGTPEFLAKAIQKMMALQVKDRPQNAQEVLDLLQPPRTEQSSPAATASRPPQVQPAPQPKAQAKPQPAPQPAPKPQPKPAPTPTPAPQPAPRPQPTPAPPTPPPQKPAPQPQPTPVPQTPAPRGSAQQPKQATNRPFTRTLMLTLCTGLGAALAFAQLPAQLPEIQSLGTAGLALSALGGAVGGFLIGWLAWFALPVILPLGAAAAAYTYAQGATLNWPTVAALSVMAAVLSIFFMRLIGRIRW